MHLDPAFILASASPRRRELLQQIGCHFLVSPAEIDETVLVGESPEDYVNRMALQKALAGWHANQHKQLPVLGADTTVVLGNDIFGKPSDQADAISMLSQLSGKTHRVLSSVAMIQGDKQQVVLSETRVTFRLLGSDEYLRYWQTGEPSDKAGAYAIQGLGAVFVTAINGSYSGVVGLPLAETCMLLEAFNISWWMQE
ncbi:MAG: Maf family protein [Porticoccus sp.]|nr:Maf family protein [Porticoccus sp.]